MQPRMATRRILRLTGLVLLLAGLLAGLAPGPAALAGGSICRRDPIIQLSDGHRVRVAATVGLDPSQVQGLTYTLHAPEGVSLVNVIYTGGALDETVVFYDDNPPLLYTVETAVQAGATGPVIVDIGIQMQGAGRVGSGGDTGTTGVPLVTEIPVTR